MAALINSFINYYYYIYDENADPYMRQYFMLGSPIPLFFVLIVYYYFIYYGGRTFMKNRKPYNLKNMMVIYNAFQVLANIVMLMMGIPLLCMLENIIGCYSFEKIKDFDYQSPEAYKYRFISFLYFFLKLSDLMDTIFMVLKKNYHQITFLHVYHHIGMCIATWHIVVFSTSCHEAFTAMINAVVHIFMYSYYLLSAYYPEFKNSIGIKKFITQIQLAQFLIIITHHTATLLDSKCSVPKIPIIFYQTQTILMIYLFSNFYYKTYIVKKPVQVNGKKTE